VTSTPIPADAIPGPEAAVLRPVEVAPILPEVGVVVPPTIPPVTMPVASAVAAPARLLEKESTALRQVLRNYEQAYDRLDVNATLAIWPSADARRLARAFDLLHRQDLTLANCTFAVSGDDATAQCKGSLQYVRRIGKATPQVEQHTWRIDLTRAGEAWRIERVAAR
jgi:hypothetical protein